MKLPQIVQNDPIKIDRFVPGGQGIGTNHEGIKGFFWNALPGETVLEYEITKKKSHYFEAIALKLENLSDYRISPKDSCYLSTSPWQIMSYSYELEQKALLLEEIFRQHDIPLSVSKIPVETDDQDFFYRNKMEYSLYYDYADEKLHLAFRKRGTHRKIKVETSSLERPEIFQKATEIINELNETHADGRNFQSLLLRCDQSGKVSGGLYENHQPHPVFPNLADTILGQPYSYSPNGFFQINLPVYELALTEIKNHIKTEDVLDLYAGVGTIGLSVASDKHLTLVEVDKAAYNELAHNVEQEQVLLAEGNTQRGSARTSAARPWRRAEPTRPEEVRPVLANVSEIIDFVNANQTVIVDPPRAGLDPKLVAKLLETPPETIIYLSCNPATQARDVKLLLSKYQIVKVQPFNFFPRTPHLEDLVVLNRK